MNGQAHAGYRLHRGSTSQITASKLQLLARHGLQITGTRGKAQDTFRLEGDTFPYDRLLTEVGANWSRSCEAWLLSEDRTLPAFLDAISSDRETSKMCLNESPAAFLGDEAAPSALTKLLDLGPITVSNEELLTLILSFDRYVADPAQLSATLLTEFGGLGLILQSSVSRLTKVDGVTARTAGLIKSIQLTLERALHEPLQRNPIIGSWKALLDYLHIRINNNKTEQLVILYLDRKNRLIKEETVDGTIDQVPLYPREIARRALELFSMSLILAHNHPSGDPSPSKSDIEMTRKLQIALSSLEITLHDHVIIGRDKHFSFKQEQLI